MSLQAKLSIYILVLSFSLGISAANVNKDLIKAAEKGDLEKVKRAIEKGADINSTDHHDWTALHAAAGITYDEKNIAPAQEIVEYLVQNGADVNARGPKGVRPLHYAAGYGTLGIAKCLLENGADVNATNDEGMTPIMSAAALGKPEMIELLLEYGADIYLKSNKGRDALSFASETHGIREKLAASTCAEGRKEATELLQQILLDQTPQRSQIQIEDFKYRIIEENEFAVKISWMLKIQNSTHLQVTALSTIQFLDKDGFALSEHSERDVVLKPKESRTLTGIITMSPKLAGQINDTKIRIE